MAGYTDIKLRA